MDLNAALNIASSGIAAVNAQLAVTSQNVGNASTPGYATETIAQSALTASGMGDGVATGPAVLTTDPQLQAAVFSQNADVAGQQVTSDALASLDGLQGTTGGGNDLASQLGALSNAFTVLDSNPADETQQGAVVQAAQTLAAGIQSQAGGYAAARQTAQTGLVTNVAALNTAVQAVGALSHQIIAAKATGISTADLQVQLNVQEQSASQLSGMQFLTQQNGGVIAIQGGCQVNLDGPSPGPFSLAQATLGAGSVGPPLLLQGQSITGQVTSGSIGAQLTLRDATVPTLQAGLDQFAGTLAQRFSNQGLALFTDPQGTVPSAAAPYTGFSNIIRVNRQVAASPNLVRDGTGAANTAAGAAAFTPNPALAAGGQAGFSTLINNVLTFTFGSNIANGVAQPLPATTGLGSAGTISLPYGIGSTLSAFAANLVSNQSQQANAAQTALTNGQALQSTLQTKLSTQTGVSVDSELSNLVVLQNSYGANAKIISAVQSMWHDLVAAVNG